MSEVIPRLNTALEGRYNVREQIGEGGMATVYLADDLKHDRAVALKVLRPELAALVGAERFLTEIKVTAGLQHPNILPLFDSGEADSFLFYVMPYVEGESLRDRLDREQQLPVDEALRITVAAAHALDHAHRKGVVHRDIKPANIMLQDGAPVVADFGIALAVDGGQGRLTETGLSIGTPYYMSPEQATGDRTIAPQSDVYSLACVLFELLAGEPPHGGGTAQAVLGRIIAGAPLIVQERRPTVPANVDAALRKALEKVPADRFGTALEFANALEDDGFRYGDLPTADEASQTARPPKAVMLGLVGVTAASVLIAGWALTKAAGPEPSHRVLTNELTLGVGAPRHSIQSVEMSADGLRMVYGVIDERGVSSLYVRESDEVMARQIPGTDGARNFTLSPSGEEVAFTSVSVGPLRAISLDGGIERTLAERAQSKPVWGDAHVYFTNAAFGITRVPVDGGPPEDLPAGSEELAFHVPSALLPNEEALLFTAVRSGTAASEIRLLRLGSGEVSVLAEGLAAVYLDGLLLFSSPDGAQIKGAPFDLETLTISGSEVTLLSGVALDRAYALSADFRIGKSGDLVYSPAGGSPTSRATPVWVDRSGAVTPTGTPRSLSPVVAVTGLALSHDGTRLASSNRGENITDLDLFVQDLRGGPLQRLSFDLPVNTRPFWGPNDEEIYYFQDPDGGYLRGDLVALSADGSGRAREILTDVGIGSGSWGVGHEWMIFRVGVPARTSRDIYALRSGESEPIELVATDATEQGPSLSPDGRWLLYQSDRSGAHDIYVRPFPDVDSGLVQISLDGGTEPRWARSGDEIFYRDVLGQMVAAQVDGDSGFRVTDHEVLFDASPYWSDPASQQYDVAPDDQRFLMLQREEGFTSLVIVWNWLDQVKARFEGGND